MYKIYIILFFLLVLFLLNQKGKEKFKINRNKMYLIPNNPKIKKELLLKLGKDKNNYLVFFNHCGPIKEFSVNELKKIKSKKILFLRANHNKSYWGKKEYENQKYRIFNSDNTFIIPSINAKMNSIINKNNLKIINMKNLIKNYPKNKDPQSGFIGFHYLKKKYPNNHLILVGFDRKHGQGDADWYHEKNYELEYYEKNNIDNIKV